MTEQKTQIKSFAHKDLDGNLIGLLDNFVTAFARVIFNVVKGGLDPHGPDFDSKGIQESINDYRAVRYCYGGDSSVHDYSLNICMERSPGLAKHIKYKPIEIKSK